jgi:DNA helicase HerA-like ATPase
MINFLDGHTTVIGRTRSGKTYTTKQILKNSKTGVLFFNVQHEKMPKEFINADGNNTFNQMNDLIKNGGKINFLPSLDTRIRNAQLVYLISEVYRHKGQKMILALDEVHLFKEKAVLNSIEQVMTTGLRWGLHCVAITQRPALIPNVIFTQSNQMVIFETNMEGDYLEKKGVPYEDVSKKIENGGKYSYIVFDGKLVKGPFKN